MPGALLGPRRLLRRQRMERERFLLRRHDW